MNDVTTPPLRLTQFSHGGGCGCKIAPALLQQIIAKTGFGMIPKDLMVGNETADDAAVWRINADQAIIATTDFFMPIVDDPFDFGAIAATNAISDVYAMGGTPLFALALVGMPVDKLPVDAIKQVLGGGEAVCAKAGIPIVGGHSIDSVEPIYGLVVIGLVDPAHVKRNAGARPGDKLVLGKPLGVGIYSVALKKGKLPEAGYKTLLASTTQLNTPGISFAPMPGVHALTDVTGFGLLGHLHGVCRASRVGARIDFSRVPLHPGVLALASAGLVTGASARNWAAVSNEVSLSGAIGEFERAVLTDPQTSGGLLVACAPEATKDVFAVFEREGFDRAAVIGDFVSGPSTIAVQ